MAGRLQKICFSFFLNRKKNILYTFIIIFELIFLAATHALAQNRNKKTSRQIEALIKEKNSRSLPEQKIDSQLLQAIKESSGKKLAEGADLEPANIYIDKDGNIKVDISAKISDELLDNIKKLGGQVIYQSRQYNTVRAKVPIAKIETIAAYEQVKFIQAAVPSSTSAGVKF